MLQYALKRLLGAIPTLLLVIVLAFLMVHAAPGGPFDDERVLPPETRAALEAAYNLDQPLHRQLIDYLAGVVTGDLGPSYHYRDYTVGELIGNAFPVSLQLGLLAILLAVIVGVAAGTVAALRRNSWLDRTVMGFAMTGISIPVFVIAPVLVLLLAVKLQWLPAGWSGADGAGRLVLPVVALALPQVAYIARLLRASLIDVLGRDFIRTARAAGLPVLLAFNGADTGRELESLSDVEMMGRAHDALRLDPLDINLFFTRKRFVAGLDLRCRGEYP